MSYYAFIIRWLLPSLLPGCPSLTTSFITQYVLRNLSVRSGLFPSRLWTLALKVCLYHCHMYGIRSFPGISKALGHPHPMSALPPTMYKIRSTSIDFAENQLYPGSIGFSPLIISHLRLLPQTWVRPSKMFYHFFSLLIIRSPGFGSNQRNCISLIPNFEFGIK